MQSFSDLGVSPEVVRTLARRGIVKPFDVQRLVLEDVIEGRDVLVKSPTGSGKTLAFGIPVVERARPADKSPAALILAPTRELASQIASELEDIARSRSLRVCAVYGGVGITAQAQRAARAHILVATPGRLEDLLARGAVSLAKIRMLVLDEADRMLDMGFLPAVKRIVGACPQERQTLFFSATLDGLAGELAQRYTTRPARHDHQPAPAPGAAGIEHRFVEVATGGREAALVAELTGDRELALVFVRTKRGADRLTKRLKARGVSAAAIHGDKSQRQREQALARFEAGHVDTLVATDVAARGIDVNGVSHVINYDPPACHDDYVHRVGRTARAGRAGVGVTLVEPADTGEMRRIARRLGIDHRLTGDGRPGAGSGTRRRRRRSTRPRTSA